MNGERALLITIVKPQANMKDAYYKEMEARSLLDTLGVQVIFHIPFTVKEENPNFLIGPGQAEEASRIVAEMGADAVIINAFLSARMEKNLESIFLLPLLDREAVILEIFSQNASSKEARLQIEKAKAEYLKPRLRGRVINLEQQRGGVKGSRGAGERLIELDRRRLEHRITQINKELEKIELNRKTQKKERERRSVFSFALLGYTNAGKSSILNELTGSQVLAEDKLFATLETTTRRLKLNNGKTVLLSDTVGFIEDLPHRLISAFSSTLSEALEADAIIIVQDLERANSYSNFLTTVETIRELGAEDKIKLLVLNKADVPYDDYNTIRLKNYGYDYIETSCKDRSGLDKLLEKLEEITDEDEMTIVLKGKNDGEIFKKIRKEDHVISAEYDDESVYIKVRIKKAFADYYESLSL